MTPRPLPDTDGHPWTNPRWDDPNGPDLVWPTVALVAAACTTAAYLAARTLLRRLP